MEKEKIFNKNFAASFVAMFSCSTIMYMLTTTMAEYSSKFAATATVAGMASGIYVFSGLFARFFSSSAMQRIGWKKFAIIMLSMQLMGSCLYFFADSIEVLLLIRIFHGFAGGACASAVMTLGTANLPKKRYAEANGYFMLSTTLAAGLGPYIGGFISDKVGSEGSFTAAIAFAAVALLNMSAFDAADIEKEKRNAGRPQAEEKKTKPKEAGSALEKFIDLQTIPICICLLMYALSYSAVMSFYRVYGLSVDMEKEFSLLFVVYSAVLLFARPLAGKIQDLRGENIICYIGMFAQTLGLALIAFKPCLLTVIICAGCCALGYGTLNSVGTAIATMMVPEERRPHAIASVWIFCDLGMGMGPTFMGMVASEFGYRAMYAFAASITLVSVPVYYFVWGRKKKVKNHKKTC